MAGVAPHTGPSQPQGRSLRRQRRDAHAGGWSVAPFPPTDVAKVRCILTEGLPRACPVSLSASSEWPRGGARRIGGPRASAHQAFCGDSPAAGGACAYVSYPDLANCDTSRALRCRRGPRCRTPPANFRPLRVRRLMRFAYAQVRSSTKLFSLARRRGPSKERD